MRGLTLAALAVTAFVLIVPTARSSDPGVTTIKGKAVMDDGTPYAYGALFLTTPAGCQGCYGYRRIITNNQGRFRVKVAAGIYTVRLSLNSDPIATVDASEPVRGVLVVVGRGSR